MLLSQASGFLFTSLLKEATVTWASCWCALLHLERKATSSPFSFNSIIWQMQSAPVCIQLMPHFLKRQEMGLSTFDLKARGERSTSSAGSAFIQFESQEEREEM